MLATISGSATSESIAAAPKKERPKTIPSVVVWLRKPSAGLEKMTMPNSARTMVGIPAIASMVDSATRASAVGRPYSESQTAIPTPAGRAIAIAIAPTIRVPISGSRMPPVVAWLKPALGAVVSRSRLTKRSP